MKIFLPAPYVIMSCFPWDTMQIARHCLQESGFTGNIPVTENGYGERVKKQLEIPCKKRQVLEHTAFTIVVLPLKIYFSMLLV